MKKIFIISDNYIFRHGLEKIISEDHDLSVTGVISDMREIFPSIENDSPDIILMDMMISHKLIISISKKLHQNFPQIPYLLVSADAIEYTLLESIIQGAAGFLWKESPPDELITAIHSVIKGDHYFRIPDSKKETKLSRNIFARNIQRRKNMEITHREREVLKCFAQGYSYRQTAEMLKISHRTVETHRKNILEKLHLKSNAELIRYAIKNQIVR